MNSTAMSDSTLGSVFIPIYALILITGIVGNVLACVVIVTIQNMHTPANCYLFSLAISDLLLLVSGLPYELYFSAYHTNLLCNPTFCAIRVLISESCNNSTIFILCAFALKRYLIVCHPLWSYTMTSVSGTIKIICGIWIIAISLGVPAILKPGVAETYDGDCVCLSSVITQHYFAVSAIFLFVLPMTMICVLCVLVSLNLKRGMVVTSNVGNQRDAASRKAMGLLSKSVNQFFFILEYFVIKYLVSVEK